MGKTIPLFRRGLGGTLGSGNQRISWIHASDLVAFFIRVIEDREVRGVFNGVTPYPVSNAQFTRTLAKALGRPAFLRTPAFVLKALLGELSSLLLEDQDVSAAKILSTGFKFQYPRLEGALKNILEGEK